MIRILKMDNRLRQQHPEWKVSVPQDNYLQVGKQVKQSSSFSSVSQKWLSSVKGITHHSFFIYFFGTVHLIQTVFYKKHFLKPILTCHRKRCSDLKGKMRVFYIKCHPNSIRSFQFQPESCLCRKYCFTMTSLK